MAKEDGGRLFSKVAKFVRNPLKDWSELDTPDTHGATLETGYSREELKEMIERRQRNDFVRRREFDMLRKLRKREATGAGDGSGTPSSFNLNSSGRTDGRALTLKKIAEIEEQMSQQWWKGRPQGGEAAPPGDAAPGAMAAEHARAYANTEPVDSAAVPDSKLHAAARPAAEHLDHETAQEEAAIRFAHGDDPGAEAILLQAVAGSGRYADHDETWHTLFDLYRATGDAEKFAATSTRYAQRFKRPAPQWVSLRMLAHSMQGDPEAATEGGIDWYAPARLDREGLADLTQCLSRAGAVWRLDWRALGGISPDAVAPLNTLFAHWADSPVQLRFAGVERLVQVLAAATPLTDRSTDLAWWNLYLSALRVMNLPDDFELVALNYCITYEVSPPSWEGPRGAYASLDTPRSSRTSAFQVLGSPLPPAQEAPPAAGRARLFGEFGGESPALWQRLDAELADSESPVITCAALVRVDLAFAGALLKWVMARDAKGQRVELVDLHRLLLSFLRVAGIADHATLTPRP